MSALSLAFSNAGLEQRYTQFRACELSKVDNHIYMMNACLWWEGTALLLMRERSFIYAAQSLAAALLWLLPCLLQRSRPDLYTKNRSLVVLAIRLADVLLATTNPLGQVLTGGKLEAPHDNFLRLLMLAPQLPKAWALSIGLRLDFGTHLLLQTLLAARLLLVQAKPLCITHSMQDLEILFRKVSTSLMEWVGFLVPMADWRPTFNASGPSSWHCCAVTTWIHLIFALFLPSAVVYITERFSRRQFLAAQPGAAGVEGLATLAQASQQLGLPAEEVLHVCMFDPIASGTCCLSLLVPLAAATWLGVVAMAAPLGLSLAPEARAA